MVPAPGTIDAMLDFARDMLAAGLQQARGLVDWQQAASAVERGARELRLVVGKTAPGARLRWVGETPADVDPAGWQQALEETHEACSQAMEALSTVSEIAPDFVRLYERAQGMAQRLRAFADPCAEGAVRWVDVGTHLRLVESLDPALRPRFAGGTLDAAEVEGWTDEEYRRRLRHSAMKRVKLPQLKRNARIVLNNSQGG